MFYKCLFNLSLSNGIVEVEGEQLPILHRPSQDDFLYMDTKSVVGSTASVLQIFKPILGILPESKTVLFVDLEYYRPANSYNIADIEPTRFEVGIFTPLEGQDKEIFRLMKEGIKEYIGSVSRMPSEIMDVLSDRRMAEAVSYLEKNGRIDKSEKYLIDISKQSVYITNYRGGATILGSYLSAWLFSQIKPKVLEKLVREVAPPSELEARMDKRQREDL